MKYVYIAVVGLAIGFMVSFIARKSSAETLNESRWNRFVCEQISKGAMTVTAPYFNKMPLDAPVCFGRLY